jgi:ketosteroid isomerase-like protein
MLVETEMEVEHETLDTADVVAAITNYSLAYNLGDQPFNFKDVENFYSKSDLLTITIPASPKVFRSWDEYSNAWASLLENFSSFFFTPNGDLSVARLGRVAWATQTGRSHGTRTDRSIFKRELRQTLVLIEEGDVWCIVQEHVSLSP